MDTIIFLLIFATLLAMWTTRRWLVRLFFFAALTATMLLFWFHVTDGLPLNF